MKKALAIVMTCIMVFALVACAKPEQRIIGTWKSQSTLFGVVTETSYTFNEDGTGTLNNVIELSFTYEFVEGKLSITTSTLGIKNTEEYTYSISSDTLTLTNDNGSVEYKKA